MASPAPAAASFTIDPTVPSFHEESNFVADLKESEQKVLHDLKLRIQLAIQNKEFSENAQRADLVDDDAPPHNGHSLVDCGGLRYPFRIGKLPETVVEAPEEGKSDSVGDSNAPAATDVPVVDSEESTKDVVVLEDAASLENISLWGVPINDSNDVRTDVVLLKFLRARDFKVNDAFTMFKNVVLWRKSFGVDKLAEEDFGTALDRVAFMHGVDKEGHPVCYNVYGAFKDGDLYDAAFGDEERISKFLRWRVRLLETGIQQLDFSPGGVASMVQVTDLKNTPGLARKELRNASKQALTLLQDNYPEFVARKVFINVPWYFSAIFSLFSPFLTQRTKSKFVVARRGKASEALFKFISPDNVPVQYGGLSRPNDSEFKGTDTKSSDLALKAGSKHFIEIPVSKVGSVVTWDLAVLGWDVSYGVEFVPSADESYTTMIEKARRMQSSELAIRNSYTASEAGKIIVSIDNTLSRKKKCVAYRWIVRAPEECYFQKKETCCVQVER